MKKLLLFYVITFISIPYLFSQAEKDSIVYHNGLKLIEQSKNSEGYLKSATYFRAVSDANPDHWLACYYTAFCYIMAARNFTSVQGVNELLDKAQQYIDKSFVLMPSEPENHILQAFLYQIRLSVEQGRVLSLSQKAESSLNKAMAADSGNPRAYFLMANNIYHTPPIFKGGPKNALPVFLKAREKFRTYKLQLSYAPSWGEKQNEEMIRLCTVPGS